MNRQTLAVLVLLPMVLLLGTAWLQSDEASEEKQKKVDLQYAEARLALAEQRLKLAQLANQELPGTYSAIRIKQLKNQVELAEARVKAASNGQEVNWRDVYLQELQNRVQIAEVQLRQAREVRKRVAGSVYSDAELKKLRLEVQVAELALEQAKQLSRGNASEKYLRWQVRQIRNELMWLETRVDRLARRQ